MNSALYKPAGSALALALTLLLGSSALAQESGSLSGGFEPATILLGASSSAVRQCSGTPDVTFDYTEPRQSLVVFFERSSGDPTLAVRDPSGRCHFNDDGGGNLNPLVRLNSPAAGDYRVFLGRYSGQRARVSGNIGISENASVRPHSGRRAATGFPAPRVLSGFDALADQPNRPALAAAQQWWYRSSRETHPTAWTGNRDEYSDAPDWDTDGFFGSLNLPFMRLYPGPLRTFGQLTYPAGTTFVPTDVGSEPEDETAVSWNNINWSMGLGLSAGYVRRFWGISTDWSFGFGRVKQQTGLVSLRLQPLRQAAGGLGNPELRIGAGYTWWSFDGATRASTASFSTPTIDIGLGVRAIGAIDYLIGIRAHLLSDGQLSPEQTGGAAWQLHFGLGISIDPASYNSDDSIQHH